jgi:hypothetical protein
LSSSTTGWSGCSPNQALQQTGHAIDGNSEFKAAPA